MTFKLNAAHPPALLLAGLFLLAPSTAGLVGCSQPTQPTPAPAQSQEEQKFNTRLSAVWYPSPEAPEQLRIELWIQNRTEEDQTFNFSNSGRICGFIQKPGGEKVYTFTEATDQEAGSETLKGGWDKTFEFDVPLADLAALPPARYEVKAWPCGYEDQFAWAEFFVHTKK